MLQLIRAMFASATGLVTDTASFLINLDIRVQGGIAAVLTGIGLMFPWVYAAFLYKFGVFSAATTFMFLSRDGRKKKMPDTAQFANQKPLSTKTIIFVRHGESAWNEVFNKGKDPTMIYRFFRAIFIEIMVYLKQDSWFIDSPLNDEGINQALDLLKFLEYGQQQQLSPEVMKLLPVLRGDAGATLLVVSNLRRAISTLLIGFSSRLLRDMHEKVFVLSNLQEISRNIDTFSILKAKSCPKPSFTEKRDDLEHVLNFYESGEQRFSVKDNNGSKTIFGDCGVDRIASFARWCFDAPEAVGKDTIIVAGHSLYFRNFFRTFLPNNSDHVSKNSKIKNCGVVSFKLNKGENASYWVDESSILEVHLGFEGKSKKA